MEYWGTAKPSGSMGMVILAAALWSAVAKRSGDTAFAVKARLRKNRGTNLNMR